uniref:SH3 domain-containing protein n=1 Tax=Caenorhabditis tropicalis TaxID=1561998 RepID=A0A1I7UFT7_9PELO
MSLFGSILSLQDAINRLPQFEYQLDDHRNRIQKIRNEEAYKKENAIEQVDKLKLRLSVLCPEKEQTSISVSVDSEEEKVKSKPKLGEIERRKSVMYDDDDSDDSDNETEIIETDVQLDDPPYPPSSVPNPPPPQPKPRQPIGITQPSLEETKAEKERVATEVAKLQNPTRGDSSDLIGPVVTREDGWWTALDENGQRGLIPKNLLEHIKEKPKQISSKVSHRLGVRDSVIALTTTTIDPKRREDKRSVRQNECLGKSFDSDIHLSLVCHLAPRLSKSNIGFHDFFWSHEKDQIFKRTVHISKIIRLVRFEKMPLIEHKALVRMALVDITNPKDTQIVSNVHTLIPRVKSSTWYFEKKESNTRSCIEFSDFVLRSNYSSPTVVLVVEASHIVKTPTGLEEKTLGHTYLRLIIDDKAVPSRTNVLYLDDEIMSKMKMPEASKKRVLVQVMDVPKDKISFVE